MMMPEALQHALHTLQASLAVTSRMLKRVSTLQGKKARRPLEAYNVFMLSDIGRSYTSSLCRGRGEGSGGDWDVCWGCSSDLLLTFISSSLSTG